MELLQPYIDHRAEKTKAILEQIKKEPKHLIRAQSPFTGDGWSSLFTLQHEPEVRSEMVYVNGVLMQAGADYTVQGGSIMMTNTPEEGDHIQIRYSYHPQVSPWEMAEDNNIRGRGFDRIQATWAYNRDPKTHTTGAIRELGSIHELGLFERGRR